MNAVDTNVLVYAVDPDAGPRGERAVELVDVLSAESTVLVWQVVCEMAAVFCRLAERNAGKIDPPAAVSAFMSRFEVVMPSEDQVLRALQLRARHQMSYWDAMLLAACAEAGATRLYAEDMQGSPVIGGVELVNPFI